jgi:hypothetical protein
MTGHSADRQIAELPECYMLPVTCCGSHRIDGYCMYEYFHMSKDWPLVVLLQITCHREHANKSFVKTDTAQLVPVTRTTYTQVEKR